MTQKSKLKPFKVVRTPKIRDSEGNYVKRGETAMLDQATAEHYHKLGFVQVSMSGVFDDDSKKDSARDPEPDSEVGSSDTISAGENAAFDTGAHSLEESAGDAPKSRRRRAAS